MTVAFDETVLTAFVRSDPSELLYCSDAGWAEHVATKRISNLDREPAKNMGQVLNGKMTCIDRRTDAKTEHK